MPRTFYCTLGIPTHPWTVESSPLKLDHENLFIPCPDHNPDFLNSEGPDHADFQHSPPLPR